MTHYISPERNVLKASVRAGLTLGLFAGAVYGANVCLEKVSESALYAQIPGEGQLPDMARRLDWPELADQKIYARDVLTTQPTKVEALFLTEDQPLRAELPVMFARFQAVANLLEPFNIYNSDHSNNPKLPKNYHFTPTPLIRPNHYFTFIPRQLKPLNGLPQPAHAFTAVSDDDKKNTFSFIGQNFNPAITPLTEQVEKLKESFYVEVCQAFVHAESLNANNHGGDAELIAEMGQESLCNGLGQMLYMSDIGLSYAEYREETSDNNYVVYADKYLDFARFSKNIYETAQNTVS